MLLHKLLMGAIICCAAWHTFSLLKRRKELGLWKLAAALLFKYVWIAILIIIICLPLRSRSNEETALPLTLILDGTQSYRLPGTEGQGRYALAVDWLKKGQWDNLSGRFDISAFQLTADGLDLFESPEDLTPPANAGRTPLNDAMESLQAQTCSTSGVDHGPVLLISDGLDTEKGLPPRVVSFPEETGPVYGIRFPYSPRSRALFSSVRHDQAVWRGAPWKLDIDLAGSWDQTVTVELTVDGEVIDSKPALPREENKEKNGRTTLSFEHRFKELGTKTISVRIIADPDSVTSMPYKAEVDVLPLPARKVWFITANPGIDAVFWKRSLRSLTSVELTSTTIFKLKAKGDELWAYQETERGREYLTLYDMPDLEQFDLVIMHGPGMGRKNQTLYERINEFLKEGGSLARVATIGPVHTYSWLGDKPGNGELILEMEEDISLGDKPFNIIDILPEEIGEGASRDLEFNPSGFIPIRLYKKEACEILLWHPTLKSAYGPYPLFKRKFDNKGIETSWYSLNIWRMAIQPGGADIHRKLVQWIMDQTHPQYTSPLAVKPENRILTAGTEYSMELIPYRNKDELKEIRAEIEGPEPNITRTAVYDYETKIDWIPRAPGTYTMRILDKDGKEIQTETLQADEHWLEWACPQMERDTFAATMEATGGKLIDASYFSVDDILLPSPAPEEVSLAEMEPLWDKWWLFLLLAAFMLGEWGTRRATGLA